MRILENLHETQKTKRRIVQQKAAVKIILQKSHCFSDVMYQYPNAFAYLFDGVLQLVVRIIGRQFEFEQQPVDLVDAQHDRMALAHRLRRREERGQRGKRGEEEEQRGRENRERERG